MLRSLRGTILLLVLVSALVPAVIVAYSLGNRLYRLSVDNANSELNLASQRIQQRLEQQLALLATQAYAFSKDPRLALAAQSNLFSGSTSSQFRSFLAANPAVTAEVLYSNDAYLMELIPYELLPLGKKRLAAIAALAIPAANTGLIPNYFWDVITDNSLSRIQTSNRNPAFVRSGKNPTEDTALVLTIPLYREMTGGLSHRQFAGLLMAIVSPQVLLEQDNPLKQGTTLTLAVQDTVIAKYRRAAENAAISNDTPLVEQSNFALNGLPGSAPIRVQISLSDDAAAHLSPVYKSMQKLGLTIAIFLTILVIFTALLTRRLLFPLNNVAHMAAQFGAGDYSTNVTPTRFGELQHVIDAFNKMHQQIARHFDDLTHAQEQLELHNVELENTITERTNELKQALQSLEHEHQQLQGLQSQLVQSEKMSSLGTLVAGVGHEINNPTNFVYAGSSNLDAALKEFHDFLFEILEGSEPESLATLRDKFVPIFEQLSAIREGAGRVKSIVTDLRTFSRIDHHGVMTRVHVADALEATLNLVRGAYKNHVEFSCNIDPHLAIAGFPGKLNQVFMNLLVNGCQAILQKRKEFEPVGLSPFYLSTFVEGSYGAICFEDSGCGIPESAISKIFEPFFTTKPVGEGTGLGLAITFGIVQEHNGRIEVSSKPGIGTVFTVYIPLAKE